MARLLRTKTEKMFVVLKKLAVIFSVLLISCLQALSRNDTLITKDLSSKVQAFMDRGSIPGLSIVVIKGNNSQIKGFGFSDSEKKETVTAETLFEIASCTKAFTALAALKLESEGLLNLNNKVSTYLPWFYVMYKGKKEDVTINQLLHHTSGIPFGSISRILPDSSDRALENTVHNLVGIELAHLPGVVYEYATINYDVVGLIIEKVVKKPFDEFLETDIFPTLGFTNTSVGQLNEGSSFTSGHKTGFFAPRLYNQPVFRGNNPAGYIISNSQDMSKWLQVQMGLQKVAFDSLIDMSHLPDRSVSPVNNSSYAYGWMVNEYHEKKIFHDGVNPNFTAYVTYYPNKKTGVVVLANSNSPYTALIGEYVLKTISDESPASIADTKDSMDVFCSILCIILIIYIALVLGLAAYKVKKVFFGGDFIHPPKRSTLKKILTAVLLGIPYVYGIYLLPQALFGFSWNTVFVWTPISFKYAVVLIVCSIGLSYLLYFLSIFFPGKNRYKDAIPFILIMSILSGLANTGVLFIITNSFYSSLPIFYLLYYFVLAYGLYILGIKKSQTKLIQLSNESTFDIRTYIMNKIIATRFGNFEQLSDGKILSTLNGDTSTIANSANIFIAFTTSVITMFSAFLYMSTISFLSTLVVFVVVLLLVRYYYVISKRARVFMEESRTITNLYISLLNDLIHGFRELCLHYVKKIDFRQEFAEINGKYKDTNVKVSLRFLNSLLVGNSFIMIILGILSIVMSRTMVETDTTTLISFVMVLLYIIGPINIVVGSIQQLVGIKVAWNRITQLIEQLDISGTGKLRFWEMVKFVTSIEKQEVIKEEKEYKNIEQVESIDIKGLRFKYVNGNDGGDQSVDETFVFGPVDLRIKAGETLFIVGDNGSGKSTLVNLLTGLYAPYDGCIKINDKVVSSTQLGEYFTVIFSTEHLFKKIYGIDLSDKSAEIDQLITKLKLDNKVNVYNNAFSSIKLSKGQRKRLALMKCFLEERHIYVFDEFAADQDPEFRRFFYKEVLPELKKEGKIVIVVTHDEYYFNLADNLVKLEKGKISFQSSKERTTELAVK